MLLLQEEVGLVLSSLNKEDLTDNEWPEKYALVLMKSIKEWGSEPIHLLELLLNLSRCTNTTQFYIEERRDINPASYSLI